MALQMPTNITPDVLSGFGGGVFDAASGLSVSWQVNGSPYMLAYRIVICANDTNSTQLYTTGKRTLSEPFYGVLPDGSVNMFTTSISASVLSSAGITNGAEYKMYITQWWGNSETDSITQMSASVIQAMSKPVVAINPFDYPVLGRAYTFTGTYTQAQGDSIACVRWTLYNGLTGAVVDDTGDVYGTSILQYSYDSFMQGTFYELELSVETQAGQFATSGKQSVTVSYPIETGTNLVTAVQECDWDGVSVTWTRPSGVSNVTGYSIYRLDNVDGSFVKLATVSADQNKLIDYSAKNGHSYVYQLWTEGSGTFLERPIASNEITPCRWNVLLIAAERKSDGAYHPTSIYTLTCNIDLGDESNNSKNSYSDTFAGYPAYQRSSNRYRSGRVTAFVGKIDYQTQEYVGDTATYVDELMALSTSNATLFLRDRKGNFRNIQIDGAITAKVHSQYQNQAVSITIPWVEVANAASTNLILVKGDILWPYDEVIDTMFGIDPSTGHLIWTYDDSYEPGVDGSDVYTVQNGHLMQTLNSTTVQMATLTIDRRGHIIANQ